MKQTWRQYFFEKTNIYYFVVVFNTDVDKPISGFGAPRTLRFYSNFLKSKHASARAVRKSLHPSPTPGNFDYPTPTPTLDRLRPSAVLVAYLK